MSADTWRSFRRTGTVRAERLVEALEWTTDGGDPLTGQAGDWRVTDGGRTWTVGDEQFRSSYEHDADDRYRRAGTVRARPGRRAEVVQTLEGPASVRPGDWVVQGGSGECWPVPAVRFAEAYALVEDDRQA